MKRKKIEWERLEETRRKPQIIESNKEKKTRKINIFSFFFQVLVFCLGLIAGTFIQKKPYDSDIAYTFKTPESVKSSGNKSLSEGGFTILPQNTKSITLENFEGTIIWYLSANFENLLTDDPTDFHSNGQIVKFSGKSQEIAIPPGVKAILRKNTGPPYKLRVNAF